MIFCGSANPQPSIHIKTSVYVESGGKLYKITLRQAAVAFLSAPLRNYDEYVPHTREGINHPRNCNSIFLCVHITRVQGKERVKPLLP